MINVSSLNFEYPGKQVLFDNTFTIPKGSITALVGPNGVGKTTLMRCLVALETPDTGNIEMNGIDVLKTPRQAQRLCGYLSDFFGLYDSLTIEQCLTYAAWAQGIKGENVNIRVEAVAKQTGIDHMIKTPAGNLSRGWRQRLGIAISMIHDPEILILDEPASGMDPDARIGLSLMLKSLSALNKTMIVSSHILNELEDYCTDMLVLHEGRIAEHVQLKTKTAERSLHIELTEISDGALDIIKTLDGVKNIQTEGRTVLCGFTGSADQQQKLLKELVSKDIPVVSLQVVEKKLQDAYIAITKNRHGG